jgi:hypothetical protein
MCPASLPEILEHDLRVWQGSGWMKCGFGFFLLTLGWKKRFD